MKRMIIMILVPLLLASIQLRGTRADGTVLSTVLTPNGGETLQRQERSYYERYGARRPSYDRLDYDRPSTCGRCDDDRYDDGDDYDRGRDRYDDDRRSNRPTSGSRYDKNKDYDDADKRYTTERKNGQKNGTEDDHDSDKKIPYDDKDRPSGGRRGNRDRDRHRYDDRDRYRPDYYDRFLRDPYRYDKPYYDDPYRERRPYDRYNPYSDRNDDGYGSRYDGYGYSGYRRPSYYDNRYDRGSTYDPYGGYGPEVGKGPHDSFRPWDETYRGQSGWDAGGRGYYFASGRPDSTPSQYWGRPEYSRPQSNGWQSVGYSSGYKDPAGDYGGSFGYAQTSGYRQDLGSGYGQASGWHSVGERRPYRDQSGVNQLDNSLSDGYRYGEVGRQTVYGQQNSYKANLNNYGSSSTTPGTSYLYEREHDIVTAKPAEDTSKTPS